MLLPPASDPSCLIGVPSLAHDTAKNAVDTARLTVYLPASLWQAVQLLAVEEGNANAVILRTLEEYLAAAAARADQPGEYHTLIVNLSRPIADLQLSTRATNALGRLNLRYLYELVTVPQWKTNALKGGGPKARREVQEKLATLGVSLGMAVDESTYRGAVVVAIVASIRDTKQEAKGQ